MEMWLNSLDVDFLRFGASMGLVYGLLGELTRCKDAKIFEDAVMKKALVEHEGPLALHVTSQDPQEMVFEAQTFYQFSSRVMVQVPWTQGGIQALCRLSRLGIPTLVTGVMSARQALVGLEARADYLVFPFAFVEKRGENPWGVLEQIHKMLCRKEYHTRLLVTQVTQMQEIVACAQFGVDAVAVSQGVLSQMFAQDAATAEYYHELYPLCQN